MVSEAWPSILAVRGDGLQRFARRNGHVCQNQINPSIFGWQVIQPERYCYRVAWRI